MADELKEERAESPEPGEETPEAQAETDAEADEATTEEPVTEAEEALAEADEEPGEKSADEIAAEEAMMAELEKSIEDGGDAENVVRVPADEQQGDPANIPANLELLMDINLLITVELGRKEMLFGEVLRLGKGSLVELNKIADEPVDIYVNQSKVAEGEVVVIDDHFGVRITKLQNHSITRFG